MDIVAVLNLIAGDAWKKSALKVWELHVGMDAVFRSRTGTFAGAEGAVGMFCDQNIIQPLSEKQLFT